MAKNGNGNGSSQEPVAGRPETATATAKNNGPRATGSRLLSAADDGTIRLAAIALAPGDEGFDSKDLEKGLFRNVSIITRGPAIGHGFDIDDVTLQQVVDAINGHDNGVKSHATHPNSGGFFTAPTDGLMCLVGRCGGSGTDVRVEDGRVRGDIQLGGYAHDTPHGDMWKFLTGIGGEDPQAIGLSISFIPLEFEERKDENDQSLPPAARVKDVRAVDFVGDPGANPDGLLASGDETDKTDTKPSGQGRPRNGHGDPKMNEALKKYLLTIGLATGATDEQATAFLEQLEDEEQKAIAEALKTKAPAPVDLTNKGKAPNGKADKNAKADENAKADADAAREEGRLAEVQRTGEIMTLAETLGLNESWRDEMIRGGFAMDDVKEKALAKLAERHQAVQTGGGERVEGGADRNLSTLPDGIGDAILLRAGAPLFEFDQTTGRGIREEDGRLKVRKPHERALKLRGLSVVEMGRVWLTALGVPGVGSLARPRIAELILSPGRLRRAYPGMISLMSTGDFPLILEDSMNKSLRAAFEEAPRTWAVWARRVTNVDFKTIKRLALSESPDLVTRPEGGELAYVTLTESRETYVLVEYANGIRFTRHAVINDDLDAFGRTPGLQAAAAARKEDDVVYAVVTANAALADGTALFHADHGNLAAAEGAPSVAMLNTARGAMRVQTGIGGDAILNISPRYLLHPAAIEGTVDELLQSIANPASSNANVTNIWRNRLVPVAEPRLDANSTSAWYLAADYNQVDTVECCFLEGEEVPAAKQETEFDTDDVKFAIRHTVAAKAIDHRGMYKNGGGG